jgi:gluconate 2-dehydrogenase gamma chain
MHRRKFIGITGAGIIGVSVLAKCKNPDIISQWRFFTDEEVRILEAACEQIIPADKDPGAKEANVVNFIDKQIVSYYKMHQNTYRIGIAGIQETSKILFNQSFEKLSFDQQYQIMLSLEAGEAKGKIWEENSSAAFFELIREHTIQGFYGSPKHGGNKNYVSYKMIGIDVPQIIGQNRYHTKNS